MQIVRWAFVVALVGACGGPALSGASPIVSTTAPSTAPSASVAAASRVEGTVHSLTASTLTLDDGTVLQLSATTRTVRTDRATLADLKTGFFVAITAKQQPDGSLVASIVNLFPASIGANVPAGQRPLADGNLMTNAPIAAIDQVSGSGFTVTFSGTTAKVTLAPGATITKQSDVRPDEIPVGTKVTLTVRAGVVQSIAFQGP